MVTSKCTPILGPSNLSLNILVLSYRFRVDNFMIIIVSLTLAKLASPTNLPVPLDNTSRDTPSVRTFTILCALVDIVSVSVVISFTSSTLAYLIIPTVSVIAILLASAISASLSPPNMSSPGIPLISDFVDFVIISRVSFFPILSSIVDPASFTGPTIS